IIRFDKNFFAGRKFVPESCCFLLFFQRKPERKYERNSPIKLRRRLHKTEYSSLRVGDRTARDGVVVEIRSRSKKSGPLPASFERGQLGVELKLVSGKDNQLVNEWIMADRNFTCFGREPGYMAFGVVGLE